MNQHACTKVLHTVRRSMHEEVYAYMYDEIIVS